MLDENRYPDLKAARYRQAIEDALLAGAGRGSPILREAIADRPCTGCGESYHHTQLRDPFDGGKPRDGQFCPQCWQEVRDEMDNYHLEQLAEENRRSSENSLHDE